MAAAQLPIGDEARDRWFRFVKTSENVARHRAMLAMAQSEAQFAITARELDSDPWLFNARNGTIDLRTGRLRSQEPADLITNLAPVDFDADARSSLWMRFLRKTVPDKDDRTFLQRSVGYSLTGKTVEQVFWLMFGPGANGKSVFTETIRAMMGSYARAASSELLLRKPAGTIPHEVANLQGARLITTTETPAGRRMDEALLKQLTGGDTVVARRLYQNAFEFQMQAKIWMATNHKPIVGETTDAMWRRVLVTPFTRTIPAEQRDRHLLEKLKRDLPGVLAWAVKGCLAWQQRGLDASDNVQAATVEYRQDSDLFGRFLEERCETGPGLTASAQVLYATFKDWSHDNGLQKPWTQAAFGSELKSRGFGQRRTGPRDARVRSYVGIAVSGANKLRLIKGEPGGQE